MQYGDDIVEMHREIAVERESLKSERTLDDDLPF